MMRSWYRTLAVLVVTGAVAGCTDDPTGPTVDEAEVAPNLAPLYSAAPGQQGIPGRYIVVFNDDVADAPGLAQRLAKQNGGEIHFTYESALKGFAVSIPAAAVQGLQRNPHVAYIEQDQVVTLSATQNNATWGLDRIDQRDRPLSGTYTYNATGSGVRAYIIDTGIRTSHNEFGGRAVSGYDAVDGGAATDCNGHGTHVAGTVGGSTYGVAKGATLVAIRVLDCGGGGTISGVIAGVNWVTSNHVKPAVANMSLGGGASTSLDNAVANSISAGMTYAIAAGNSNANACNSSPARVSSALTVASSTSSDSRSSFSNYGSCVDLFAPGSSITAAWHTSNSATNTISGTSMAAPHVAGAAALYLQGNSGASPGSVASAILGSATTGRISGANGSPNRLLYSLFGSGGDDGGSGGAPCSNCEAFSGSLSGTGAVQYQPNGTYYRSSSSGTHRGWLEGPSSADFDLYLMKWNGSRWVDVAQSISSTSSESIAYSGTSGYYAWRVVSYSGSGSYNFWMRRP